MRVKLEVAYDGTNYCGWQIQPNVVTVEGMLNQELSRLLKEDITVIGASRTDSGVHAFGNVAVFDTNTRIPAEKISYALNQSLPDDIVVQSSCEVQEDFHPRYCDCIKTYEYKILNATFPEPTKRLYTHFVHRNLDAEAMQTAANYFIGRHDFVSFCSSNTQVKDTTREIYNVDILKDRNVITIRIRGNGFLYNMVRIIAGTLIQVGSNFIPPEQVKEILEAKDRTKAGPTAPAKGLTLVGIEYL
ncbi:tRNA pseudouridine(38-40) synthase TruA [Clostridium sp. Marseille-P299]|uniref:tRNA pseudouridine(38-40) synthase TruA n=1 Tax=Clostridium sp. Marseille-P299 TaxID=1805477 RepID=UPI000830A82D|nr:tRNA pseudouridine(38-40) synthase TruA [Clostridium sp. Marseille-P299]